MSDCDVCLRSEQGICPSCAPSEIARLRAALAAAEQEIERLKPCPHCGERMGSSPKHWCFDALNHHTTNDAT